MTVGELRYKLNAYTDSMPIRLSVDRFDNIEELNSLALSNDETILYLCTEEEPKAIDVKPIKLDQATHELIQLQNNFYQNLFRKG